MNQRRLIEKKRRDVVIAMQLQFEFLKKSNAILCVFLTAEAHKKLRIRQDEVNGHESLILILVLGKTMMRLKAKSESKE